MNKLNVWRKPISNIASQYGTGMKRIIRRRGERWQWLLMRGDEMVDSGFDDRRADAEKSATKAKAAKRNL